MKYKMHSRISNDMVIKTTVKNLDKENVKPKRAGVILYTVYNTATYFGFGLDSVSHDLTDFAGHIDYELDKNVIDGALREFNEETLGIFDNVTSDVVADCPVIYDKQNLLIFVHVDIHPNIISSKLNSKFKQEIEKDPKIMPEVCGITWLSFLDLQSCINTNKKVLFFKVKNLLKKAGDFWHLL